MLPPSRSKMSIKRDAIKRIFGGARWPYRWPSGELLTPEEQQAEWERPPRGPEDTYKGRLHHEQGSGVDWALGVIGDAIQARLGGYGAGGADLWSFINAVAENYRNELEVMESEMLAQNMPRRTIWNQLDARAMQIGQNVPIPRYHMETYAGKLGGQHDTFTSPGFPKAKAARELASLGYSIGEIAKVLVMTTGDVRNMLGYGRL